MMFLGSQSAKLHDQNVLEKGQQHGSLPPNVALNKGGYSFPEHNSSLVSDYIKRL
jgi:hypothetical protein